MRFKTKEVVTYLVVGIFLFLGGFYFAFADAKPFAALPQSAVSQGTHFDATVGFQFSSIPVALGCLALVIGGSFLLAAVRNLLHMSGPVYTLYSDVLYTYRLPLTGLLVYALFEAGVREGFSALSGDFLSALWQLPIKEILGVVILVVKFLVLTVGFETAILIFVGNLIPEKVYKASAWILTLLGMVGIAAITATNLWYWVEALAVVTLFAVYAFLVEKREKKLTDTVLQMMEESGVLDELDL